MQPEPITLSPPPFKHSEIKSLLTDRIKELHPSFRFLTAATGVYHFQRLREFHGDDLKEALHFVFSTDYSFHVSISSRLDPIHTLTPVYNDGFINPHVDLAAIMRNDGFFPSPGTAYLSNGTIEGVTSILEQAIGDFTKYGITWLDNRWIVLKSNGLVKTGMDIIDKWNFDKTMLRNELNIQLKKAKLVAANLRHPVCNELKEQLALVAGQPPEHYKEIPRLAFELMELYCNSRIMS